MHRLRHPLKTLALVALLTGAPLSAIGADADPTLYFLSSLKVMRVSVTGEGLQTLYQRDRGGVNDGVAYDPVGRHIYWTDMGAANLDDGLIRRADFDGANQITVIPPGGTFTPKQMTIDHKNRKLYWSDREGMRVMRSNFDGSGVETLVITGQGEVERRDAARWCVGIAVDPAGGWIYWTQKGGDNAGQGSIRRAHIAMPRGQSAADRTDVQVLFSGLPEPIDLDLDVAKGQLYWTDRGDNTVSRAAMNPPRGFDPAARTDREILVRGLREAIGLALDLKHGRMFYTSLGGEVGTAKLDGSDARLILTNQGGLTGITLVEP